ATGSHRRGGHDPVREVPRPEYAFAGRGGSLDRPGGRLKPRRRRRDGLLRKRRLRSHYRSGDDTGPGSPQEHRVARASHRERGKRVRLGLDRRTSRLARRRLGAGRCRPSRGGREDDARGKTTDLQGPRSRRGPRGTGGSGEPLFGELPGSRRRLPDGARRRGAAKERGEVLLHGRLRPRSPRVHGEERRHAARLRRGSRQEPRARRPQPQGSVPAEDHRRRGPGEPRDRRSPHTPHVLAHRRRIGGPPPLLGGLRPAHRRRRRSHPLLGAGLQCQRGWGRYRRTRREEGVRPVGRGPRGPRRGRAPRRRSPRRACPLRGARALRAGRGAQVTRLWGYQARRAGPGQHERWPLEQGPSRRRYRMRPDCGARRAATWTGRGSTGRRRARCSGREWRGIPRRRHRSRCRSHRREV
ncbi:MAG: 3-ketoacyl-CoA thiolase, partial [uncultured Rubrobacteraceae bacterium]